MEEDTCEGRPKRLKRDTSYKAKAFEKFKQLKSGSKHKYEVDEIENIYDTVDEKEYTKKVLERQDDDWIVDDDGSGYIEDGREIFDDDLDKESIAQAASSKTNSRKGKKRKKGVAEQPSKASVQVLMSHITIKNKVNDNLDGDDILNELLEEINDSPGCLVKPPNKPSLNSLVTKQVEKQYMSNLTKPKSLPKPASPPPRPVLKEKQSKVVEEETSIVPTEETQLDDCFNDDLDLSAVDIEEVVASKLDCQLDTIEEEMMKDWVPNSTTLETTPIIASNFDLPLVEVGDNKVFRFFWWDAYENPLKQPGVVFLFGKVYHEKSNSYISCSVAVRNIERKIFFLPRKHELGSTKLVTPQDVYIEIKDKIMKGLQVKEFRAKPTTKRYAFNPEIPAESEYIEVRYSARDPPVRTNQGNTFWHVFGVESSYLEILLLDTKIKGPCWLDIANPSPVNKPCTWCKLEITCNKVSDISVCSELQTRPPLVVAAINMRRSMNSKNSSSEIVMLSCVTNIKYSVDKPAPSVPFQKHFCVFTCPSEQVLPMDLFKQLPTYTATKLQKVDNERALLNYFIKQFVEVDCDLVVGHDLQGYQINILAERLFQHQLDNFSKLSRINRRMLMRSQLEKELFVGRLVCDVKISAKELIKCRSYDLDTLCQQVLKINENQRIDLETEDIPKMFETTTNLFKLASLTMQDTAFILKIMYNLNIIPLALQITNIAGNVMSKTLMGGRSERNEFLLLHAFSERNYIVPDKIYKSKSELSENRGTKTRKKPTYSGGLVLEPRVGFYDTLILLMDFNSLYPSIIQEYNICFTTMPPGLTEDKIMLPDSSAPPGILPSEIRKLVESRRGVKKLMNNPEISSDLKIQYHIRQMALKLTANSMYGCLGFSNSRFYARNLAALITHKGREILTNTKELVERMGFDVIYGDTDSLMINTNILDYDEVFKIGNKIKVEINKLYKQVELDIDGVFKFLLLLKKKKYAAVTLTKDKNGELKSENEFKGLDIVRRDWSRLASEAGRFTLQQILSDRNESDDRFNNIYAHLRKLREDLEAGKVPLSLLVITKQLAKNPNLYTDVTSLPHVQVALRYNKECGGHYHAGDTIPYVICKDGTNKAATQRAYHIEELKNNSETLQIDVHYYLNQQIHPVVNRICEPIEELDPFQIADCLGVDISNVKLAKSDKDTGVNITRPEFKFKDVDAFTFRCLICNGENLIDGPIRNNVSVLEKCAQRQCNARPLDYLSYIQNQLIIAMNAYVNKYYKYEMYCEDPMCNNVTDKMPIIFSGRFPLCNICGTSVMLKKYTEFNLFSQLFYFHYIFDLNKLSKKPLLQYSVEKAYQDIKEIVEKRLQRCAYYTVDMAEMFSIFTISKIPTSQEITLVDYEAGGDFDEDDY